MKAFVVGILVVVASAAVRPVFAQAAVVAAASAPATRPLVQFLMNTLQLQDQQVLKVEQALKRHPTPITTADELQAALSTVLTPAQLARLQAQSPASELQAELHYLATLP